MKSTGCVGESARCTAADQFGHRMAVNARLPVKISYSTSPANRCRCGPWLRPWQLLGRHVGGRAAARVGAAHRRCGRPDAEIGERTCPRAVEHDVGGLQIAMQDALIVRRGHARAELARDLEGLVGGQAADALEQRREVFAVHVLHGDELHAVDFADIVDAADVGMRVPAARCGLRCGSARARRAGCRGRRGQELQSDRLIEREIVGAVDFAHAAEAQQADDTIPLGQNGARIEPAPRRGIEGVAMGRTGARNVGPMLRNHGFSGSAAFGR